ncbi:hypothetical protein LCGC14_1028270 [marine sediment metagenome]|uniref:Uncharacterized protein n=1 Tax=marine sediment metagenome TaxID=412755 RepID=A0A0F9MVH6_9ZZZZ
MGYGNNYWQREYRELQARQLDLREERDRLQAIVDKLEKTKDGVHVVPGDTVWRPEEDGTISKRWVGWGVEDGVYWAYYGIKGEPYRVFECYSTLAAAEQAAQANSEGVINDE